MIQIRSHSDRDVRGSIPVAVEIDDFAGLTHCLACMSVFYSTALAARLCRPKMLSRSCCRTGVGECDILDSVERKLNNKCESNIIGISMYRPAVSFTVLLLGDDPAASPLHHCVRPNVVLNQRRTA